MIDVSFASFDESSELLNHDGGCVISYIPIADTGAVDICNVVASVFPLRRAEEHLVVRARPFLRTEAYEETH